MSRVYDITQPLRTGIPVWPGDTDYVEDRVWAIGPDCPVNVSRLTLSTHTGTHADAPLHYDEAGVPIGAVDLDIYLGPALVLHMPPGLDRVAVAHLAGRVSADTRRLLLRTYASFPHDAWDSAFTAMDADAIDWLAGQGVRLIGVDAPSLDPQTSKTMDAHMAVRGHGMAILEGLVLDAVPEGIFELIALPLRLATADAAPVRAVLRVIDKT
ncbi:arylformamidase [Niveispirillum sp.]|uniref:arylformamidase n=1 Tax=Niveispirillum sp. TaxID=1917217 RepID=UPI001B4A62FD|nr:arylformamidase [Niveispirillum sp.]MBP7337238.1 arylformamidase [Niveispirillum sp.]